MTEKSIAQQVKDAQDELDAAVVQAEVDRLAALRAEIEANEKARAESRDPLKIGERKYAPAGSKIPLFVIVGAPRLGKERWVTIAPAVGGVLASYPEEFFRKEFWDPANG